MLENVEKIVEYDSEFFTKDFMLRLLDNCHNLTIMFSSCEWVEVGLNHISRLLIPIMELDRVHSVKLFLATAGKRDINAKEVYDLIQAHKVLELEEVFPGQNA